MDETPLSFDLPNPTTVTQHGSKSVTIRTTGHQRTCFTVILACMADGSKLPPMCIFKLKNKPRDLFPDDVHVRVNEKGWCNENEMKYWIENVWSVRQTSAPRSLLILDSFRGHLINTVKSAFEKQNTDMAVIPGGLTSKLQPLDVAVNKSFKHKVG